MESIIELVLYCLLWVLLQGVIYIAIYYINITYNNACGRVLFNNMKIVCYLIGALLAGCICVMKKKDFFKGVSCIRLYEKVGFFDMFILQGILLVTAIYVVELMLRMIFLNTHNYIKQHNALEIVFMKGKINISELIMGVLIAPLLEEMLFRGLLYERVRILAESRFAIIIVGIVFGLFHINPKKMGYASLVSMVLSLCYINGGIITAMLCHSFYNFLSNFYISIKKENTNETK